MAIPDFQSIMLPLLRFCADGTEHTNREALDALAKEFGLTEDEQKQLLPSGQQCVIDNRVAACFRTSRLPCSACPGFAPIFRQGVARFRGARRRRAMGYAVAGTVVLADGVDALHAAHDARGNA
jgi:restriction endonuclease Mrr